MKKTVATTKASALADALVEDLERHVLSGALPPGSRFPTEAAMVASHGVSRTVVREAFARLAAAGLLESRRGSGAYVAEGARYRAFQITADELREIDDIHRLIEMRTPLEIEMAALAAERRSGDDIKAMKAAIDALLAAEEVDAAVDADTAFHTAIARATRNDYFTRFTEFLGIRLVPRAPGICGAPTRCRATTMSATLPRTTKRSSMRSLKATSRRLGRRRRSTCATAAAAMN